MGVKKKTVSLALGLVVRRRKKRGKNQKERRAAMKETHCRTFRNGLE